MSEFLLNMTDINKQFPGVRALDNVSLQVRPGEIHGLLGENGAGKSTLLKILSGAYRPDSGQIEFDGKPLHVESPLQAQQMGIVTIYQEFNLMPNLSIAENVYIGREPGNGQFISWGNMRQQTKIILDRLGLRLDPMTYVRSLSVADQQMVEIARALSMESKLIIMDEPTSALSENEVNQLFKIMRELKRQGLSIIFVSHRLEEVRQICDRITVLRDGRNVGAAEVKDITTDDIIRMMVGRSISDLFHRDKAHKPGGVVLSLRGVSRHGNAQDPHASVLEDINLDIRLGEILGIAGLVGAGRTELARVIFGADPFSKGEIVIEGRPVRIKSPQDAIRHGIGLVPEDRKQQALFLSMAVRENLSIATLGKLLRWNIFVREKVEQDLVENYRKTLNVRMANSEQQIANLSGGNQQKVILARWLAMKPKLLIVDEPTRGIDVAAKAEVHALLNQMAQNGIAVVMISSELPEILGMSDRIVTLREGRLTGEIMRHEATEEKLMQMMTMDKPVYAGAST
jgi:inositol transport system ATP-binding protein